ncbi:MAG TPA: diaminopimelate aminotransferase [Elusimicrobia bacterium]|nr:diaminopimelate aminotransferase [Elusimicrobiota bacterium]HBT61533.1 diaminopimelate aminotransferase [Elusimicrobiota bacterium]
MKEQILKKIESYRDYAVELQRGLTAIPAIAPSSGGEGEHDKAVWLDQELRKLQFDDIQWYNAPHQQAKNGIRPNIVARWRGQSSKKTLWIMSHLDIVPPGERKLWKTDPYTLHVENGKLYGRGVEDNQQAVVASMLAARAMMECGYRPPVDLALMFVADEETGSDYGAIYLAEKHPELFGKADMFLVPDGGEADGSMVEIAEKSLWWLKITTRGKQCHASMPDQGRNAFKAASDLVTRLQGLYKKFPKKDKLYFPPMSTFEPTKKEANVPNINTIPGEDVFCFDSRVLPQYKLKAVEAEIRKLAKAVEKRYGVKIAFETAQRSEAAPPTPLDAEIVRLISEAIKEIHGVKAKPMGIGGGTVAAVFRRLGLPAVVSARLEETAHQPNESCILDNLIGDAKVCALTAMKTSGGKD